jgi:osmotically inducible lipoprotein OsmB
MKITLTVVLALLLVACGESKFDRGMSGAAIGAGAGAATGAATGGSILGGGLLGGAAGGAAGVLTDEDDVDLGKPVWRR